MERPTGTVTFLFTDIEGSTKLAQEHRGTWEALRTRHDAILRAAIESNGGFIFQIIGDAFCAAFHTAGDALKAAIKSQIDLQAENGGGLLIRVRMGIHTGEAEADGADYRGYLTLSVVQRVMSAGHGGQILLSNATENLLRGQLPKDTTLRDLGEHKLKGVLLPVRIFQAVIPGLPGDFPALHAPDVFPNNLPAQFTSFVGREREMAEVKQAVTDHRLVTLTGAGGTGKTRLSLQAAILLSTHFPDGSWFIELAPVSDPDLIPQTILTTLGLSDRSGQSILQLLLDFLKEKKLLLILDNCEHLIEASAHVTTTLLNAAPGLKVLASSREALGVTGELSYPVPSLALPDPKHLPGIEQLAQCEAVQLFMDRARLVAPHFDLDKDIAPFVAQICSRLDGIPLAIELAAARVKVLSPEQIVGRLDDRFRLLTSGTRAALPRHQTLRTMIDWSYNLLSEPEKTLFRRLAVFAGGWSLEAAESVCSGDGIEAEQILDLMSQLVNKSLVIAETVLAESRYHMLETIRQYAGEKLFESAAVETSRNRHLEFYLKFAEEAEPFLESPEQAAWLERLENEHDNIRAAWYWLLDQKKVELAARFGGALRLYWFMRGYLAEGRQHLEESLRLFDAGAPSAARAEALNNTGFLARYQGDYKAAKALIQESLAIQRALANKHGVADALSNLGFVLLAQGDCTGASGLYKEAIELHRELGNEQGIADSLTHMAQAACLQGDYNTAHSLDEQCLTIWRKLGDRQGVAWGLARLGNVVLHQGNYSDAQVLFNQSLDMSLELSFPWGIATSIEGFAALACVTAQPERAVRLTGAAAALRESIGVPLSPAERADLDEWLAPARRTLNEDEVRTAWLEGHAMSVEQAIEFASKDGND